jgi:hypothetical protein
MQLGLEAVMLPSMAKYLEPRVETKGLNERRKGTEI